ncbi:cell surface protein [Streptococcus equi subsp. zooepidemicus]|uniref:cell surface protein n=1 Tax=Streptococcus equi TaxID=1336 RepID=UPI001E56FB1F|nr:cell surface protein [Streptococcus equi]MCD3370635.1 cell surface protein [Streptococcus equi subsp. zooepidemicus]MCD3381505.1 cell surface protein [Streptococcus equi subsp. zooepidemicus]HEL0564330.1 cell surface protein [Streptococcus equi subsp. zooepidemicus]HEL1247710.1 cell surface protein [Streptococcus equi subsp. zooepidemicus]HEL1283167.1 cell surface protein [Streptococcus equi subsp. zooepidemicus]
MLKKRMGLACLLVLTTFIYQCCSVTAEQYSDTEAEVLQINEEKSQIMESQEVLEGLITSSDQLKKKALKPKEADANKSEQEASTVYLAEDDPVTIDSSDEESNRDIIADSVPDLVIKGDQVDVSEVMVSVKEDPSKVAKQRTNAAQRYSMAKHQLTQKFEAFNTATNQLLTMIAKKSDLTGQYYVVGHSLGEMLAAQNEKKLAEQLVMQQKHKKGLDSSATILDELGRVISDISGHKGMLPFNRKISFKAHQVRYDLPLTGDRSVLTAQLAGLLLLLTGLMLPKVAIKKS